MFYLACSVVDSVYLFYNCNRQEFRSLHYTSSGWLVVASLRRIRILRNLSEITLHCGLQVSDFSTITRIKWLRPLTTYSEQEVYKQRFKKNDKAWSTFAPNSKLQVKAVSHV